MKLIGEKITSNFILQMMLLRSSSTPISSSIIEDAGVNSKSSWRISSTPETNLKISLPANPSPVTRQSKHKHIRRVTSDGNLHATSITWPAGDGADSPLQSGKVFPTSTTRHNEYKSMIKLEPIPSFSLYDRNGNEIEDEEELAANTGDDGDGFSLPPLGSHYANRSDENETFGLSESLFCQEPRYLCLALGLGVDPDRAETKKSTFSDERTQQHYQNLLHDDPCNPLILRNYATYLNKVKGDYEKAEKLYSRAILANPNDGEVLSEYAKLRWKVRGDQERASNYFERAVKASPQNSHVVAAYASFLWNIEKNEDEREVTIQ